MRTHLRYRSTLSALLAVIALTAIAEQTCPTPTIAVRDLEPSTVLYTIHRGPYTELGLAFGRLYGLAGSMGLRPTGSALTVHLNNPQQVSEAHWLTEVRIPVGPSALNLTGTLGPMTDVKTVPGVKVAVAVKPAGMASPELIQKALYQWIYKNGYAISNAPMQRVIGGAQINDYTQMEVEIMIPIAKPENIAVAQK